MSKNLFLSTKYNYDNFIFNAAKKYSRGLRPVFLPVSELRESDTVIIPSPLKNVQFLSKKWEISGDYCRFLVSSVSSTDVVLVPTRDMDFRDNGINMADRAIRIQASDDLILVAFEAGR